MSDSPVLENFYQTLAEYYVVSGRHDMLWRQPELDGSYDPYKILVSEIMLQQTQVDRVTPKFAAFIDEFPDVRQLAAAPLSAVLTIWSGLGYNRRAKYLWEAAQKVVSEYGGVFPDSLDELRRLPGVGPNTAGAICAYAYNQPVLFVETNIRTVIIHHFYNDAVTVSDKEILAVLDDVVTFCVSGENVVNDVIGGPRQLYWAMMDYGSHLKKSVGNLSRLSSHYKKHSTFHGSRRQIRGEVLRLLTSGEQSLAVIRQRIDDERLDDVLLALQREGMISRRGSRLRLA